MKPLNIEILKRLTSNVLETTCFLFQSEENPAVKTTENEVSIRINCGTRFSIYLIFDQKLSTDISCNMLGLSANELTDEIEESTLKEITNMIGGNFMNSVQMPATTKLSLPEVMNGGPEAGQSRPVTDVLSDTVYIENRPVKITLVEYAS